METELNKIFDELQEEAYNAKYHTYDYKITNQIIRKYFGKYFGGRAETVVSQAASQACAVAENMITDKREIKIVCNDEACVTMWKVGSGGVTKIECYGEYGEYAVIPFLAIYKGEQIVERSPALKFRIVYES